ncbi:hypothetical protein FA15DRAFT_633092 [Coprinopsis marcescibilis]|uniref:PX domain-containing protein n=1 Tax=Coprinopsis marcescibilis TaxID=230819 RepID=A0A5C3L6T5_COPMA|nr:hypothetical protein FA15DRAFT_633092 [Coprinopsis marcescibilis]
MSNESSDLTPLRAHYLKKALIQLQFGKELDQLASTDVPGVSNLSFLGPPFTPIPKSLAPSVSNVDLPFLKYVFRQFVLTFPFMSAAPKGFYSEKVQPFVDAMLSRNIASASSLLDTDGAKEKATRKKLVAKIERNIALFVGSATKLVEQEQVVRLTQQDLDRLERLAQKRQKRLAKKKDYFQVNVVGVRTVVDKGRMRSRAHEEFIIRTRRARYHDIYVSRRYGDFKTLANELAKRYPEENVRPPPPKDRSYVTTGPSTPMSPSFHDHDAAAAGSLGSAGSHLSWDADPSQLASPASPHAPNHPSKLAREKNRLTLRAYFNSLLSSYAIASSPVIKSFLLSGYITLSPAELEDARKREEADRVREDGRKRFAKEIAARVDGLREAVKSVKGDLMGKDGLTNVFGTIKVTPHIKDLPDNYQAVVEWARISLASTVFHTFVASDTASETFAGLKRIHSLMPYLLLKGALKIANPIAMIRTVLDLFLAQPFGGRSLLQRMFTSSLTEEVRILQSEIELVKEKIDDPIMSDKIRQFAYAPKEIQAQFKADSIEEKMDIVVVVLRSAEEPALSRAQMHRLARAHREHTEWIKARKDKRETEGRSRGDDDDGDSDDDDGPPNEDAWLIEDLRVLTALYQQLRDKEQLIELIFEGFTAELLKDIITIFYSPLAQVYRAANIADSLNDLQNFIYDLIKTVEQVEELSQVDPQRTVQAFINLIQRHEQSFYSFVHKVHSKGDGLFDSIMRWIELFLTVVREGLGKPISLEFLLPHSGTQERQEIMEEVDKVALYHYKLKVIYEDKLRRRFGRAQKSGNGIGTDADAEDEAAKALVDGVIGEISFGELAKGDAIDLAAQETDEEDSSGDSEDESGSEETSSGDESSSEYETSSEADHGSTEGKGKDKPLPAQPSVAQVQSQSHVRAGSVASLATQRQPPQPQPQRKRSMPLKRMKSLTSLLNGKDKNKSVPPPVPPVPASVSSSDTGSPYMTDSPRSSLSISGGRASTSSSRPSSSASKTAASAVKSPLSVEAPASAAQEPRINKENMTDKPLDEARKPKKKSQPLDHPELKHIPLLLPVFVEMMRPGLVPRKRTMNSAT